MRLLGLLLCLALLQHASPSHGQAPDASSAQGSSAPAAPPAALPDVVLMNDGGMVRGTIIEFVPGEFVSITGGDGQTRRYEAGAVRYAGPSSSAPQEPAEAPRVPERPLPAPRRRPLVSVVSQSARFKFRIDPDLRTEDTLTLHLADQSAQLDFAGSPRGAQVQGYQRICTAPCDAEIAAGTYVFGISRDGGKVIKVKEMQTVSDGDVLVGNYRNGKVLRALGLATLIASTVGGFALLFVASATGPATRINVPPIVGGCVLFAVGIPVGAVLRVRGRDRAELHVAGH